MANDPNLSTEQNNAMGVLESWLGDFNLSSLAPTLRQWIIDGYDPERIKLEITKTSQFAQEFPEYQAAIKAGNPMTPADIINYRTTTTQLFRMAELPQGFYDSKDDFVDLITKGLSPAELQDRVTEGYAKVASAPQAVKDAFSEYFGVQGPNMMATFFLDPVKGTELIDKSIRQAEVGGYGTMYGFNIGAAKAGEYAERGIGGQQAQQAFQEAFQLKGLAEETMGETGDMTAEEIAEGTLVGGEARERARRRGQERSAAFGGGGGSGTTRTGLGLGGT